MMIINAYHAVVSHWPQILVGSVFLLAICYICAAAIFAIMAAHEEAKQERQRAALDRIMRANEPPKDWPTPKGHKTPWKTGRVS